MPVEFTRNDACIDIHEQIVCGSMKLMMAYDGSGRRISKTFLTKSATAASWDTVKVTHYTGIGTEVREEFHNGTREKVNVVVNMPEGLDRYKVADASQPADDNASRTFEWYLKNPLGSTMLVYGTVASTDPNTADIGETKAAYDYRAFGEMVTLSQPSDKVTENFTGKEHDDEIALNYFGARYLDPMLGMWISVDPARQFASPYLYAGNRYNPIMSKDEDGNRAYVEIDGNTINVTIPVVFTYDKKPCPLNLQKEVMSSMEKHLSGQIGEYNLKTRVVRGSYKGMMANEISIESGKGRAHANRFLGTETLYKGIGKKGFEFTSAHEGAHLMGLEDKYVRGTNIPFEGYDDNLMGKWGEFNLKPEQVEEIINHPANEIHEDE